MENKKAPGKIFIRDMQFSDLDQVVELEKVCFSDPWTRTMFEQDMQNKQAFYRVLEINEEIVAYGGMWLIFDEAHIMNIATSPHHRKKGLGEQMMRTLITEAKHNGAGSMTLEVRAHNEPAKCLYKKIGFKGVGFRPKYYPNGEDALIMWLHVL